MMEKRRKEKLDARDVSRTSVTSAPDGAHDKRWKRLEMDVAVSKALHRPATPPSAQIFTFSVVTVATTIVPRDADIMQA